MRRLSTLQKKWMIAAAAICCATFLAIVLNPGSRKAMSPPPTRLDAQNVGQREKTPTQRVPDQPPMADYLYLPGIMYGDAKSSNIVAYYWSASQQASIDGFKKYVEPLIRRLLREPSSSYAVLLYQILEDDKRDALGPGGLLLCPDDRKQYEWLAVEYLRTGKEVGRREPLNAVSNDVHFSNATVNALAKKYGIELRSCVLSGRYNMRWARVVGDSLAHEKRLERKTYPFFSFDNALVPLGDPRLKKLETMARSP